MDNGKTTKDSDYHFVCRFFFFFLHHFDCLIIKHVSNTGHGYHPAFESNTQALFYLKVKLKLFCSQSGVK